MQENIRNPFFNQVQRVNYQKAEEFTAKDKEIEKAYHTIVYQIRLILCSIPVKLKRRYLEYRDDSKVISDHILKEFVCNFCSVSLTLKSGQYQIVFTIGSDTIKEKSVNYNKLLRVAYKLTMHENTNICIEDVLQFELADNQRYYFLKRWDNFNPLTEILSQETIRS